MANLLALGGDVVVVGGVVMMNPWVAAMKDKLTTASRTTGPFPPRGIGGR